MKSYILPILLFLAVNANAQSNTTTQLKHTYTDSSFTYLYGSVIRASANLSNSTALVNLIKNVDLIIYSELDLKTHDHALKQFNDLIPSLKNEKFKQLIKVNEGESLQKLQSVFADFAVFTLKNADEYTKVFLTMRAEHKVTIVDITGNLSTKSLTGKDITALLNLFNRLKDDDVFNLTRGNDDAENNKSN